MAYVNPDTLQEVSNILDDFDEATLTDLFKSQILQEESYISIPVNHFEPLYKSYRTAMDIKYADEDDIAEVKARFQNICVAIIQFIEEKYSISVDMDWIESQFGKLPAITKALYYFFVLDIFYVIVGVLNNYIHRHAHELFEAFKDVSNKRDVTTITKMKTMSPEYAVIASSLFDVTDYVFSMLDNEVLFDYINTDYLPATAIRGLMNEGAISGDFTRRIADIYKESYELRTKVYVELNFRIMEKGYLEENPIIVKPEDIPNLHNDDEDEAPASEGFTNIDSDVDID